MDLVPGWQAARPAYERQEYRRLVMMRHPNKRPPLSAKPRESPTERSLALESVDVRCIPYVKETSETKDAAAADTAASRGVPFGPVPENSLVPPALWADVVGLHGPRAAGPRSGRAGALRPFESDPATYWAMVRAVAEARTRMMFVRAIDAGEVTSRDISRWSTTVVDMWSRVHQSSERYGASFYETKYSCDLHTVCVLYDMRNANGYRVPRLASPWWFKRAEEYELEHPYVTLIEHDPLVARVMPEKLSLSRAFSRIAAEESTQRVAEASKPRPGHKGSHPSRSGHFVWSNKNFSRALRLLHRCLFHFDHVTHHLALCQDEEEKDVEIV